MSKNKQYRIVRDKEGVLELANYIKGSTILAFDTETTSVNPRQGQIIGFSVSADIGEGYYFPTRIWNKNEQKLEQLFIDSVGCDDIAKKLIGLTKGKKLVGHNMSFDIRFVKNFYGIDLRDDLYCQ